MPAKSTRKPRVPMPPPSPALTRLEAERAARAAAAKSPPPEDSLSELEALNAKFDKVKRERDEAMAKVRELTDELEAATYSEEQVRALLAEARTSESSFWHHLGCRLMLRPSHQRAVISRRW